MKTLVIVDENAYCNVFSLDENGDILTYPSLTTFVNYQLALPHLERYDIRTIFTGDVYDEQERTAIYDLTATAAIPEPDDQKAFWAFNMLYNSEDSYAGIQLD